MAQRVVIIGAGITGLSAAYYLRQRWSREDLDVTLLETGATAGGVIKTHRGDGCLMEFGPEAFLTSKPAALDLIEDLGIGSRLLPTSQINRRTMVARKSALHNLPDGFVMFAPSGWRPWALTTLLSPLGKARMALDLVIPPRQNEEDESLAEFVRRRLGGQALERLAQPLIGAVYGGNPELLSARCTIPQMVRYEAEHGSIIRGLAKQNRNQKGASGGPRYGLFASFDEGMQVLTDELVSRLAPGSLLLNTAAEYVVPGIRSQWQVSCAGGRSFAADAVIICTGANRASDLLSSVDSNLSQKLKSIRAVPAVLINLLFESEQILSRLQSFGFVVPASEKCVISACTFSSVKFAGRAENGKTLLRIFLNAQQFERCADWDDERMVSEVMAELGRYLSLKGKPIESCVVRHRDVLPQYDVGHQKRIQETLSTLSTHAGLFLAGNSYHGMGIPDCIASGKQSAESASNHLQRQLVTTGT
ncbi:MAG: protoporphyrinogen oxidase [Candidatus Obscuribacterales bacterium]